jgi:hypothetical protein
MNDKDRTEKDWDLEARLNKKSCEFCGEPANGLTRSGGSVVFHCSACVLKLGQDTINSRLPMGETAAFAMQCIRKNGGKT